MQGLSTSSLSSGRVQLWGLGCSHSLLQHRPIPRALLAAALSPGWQNPEQPARRVCSSGIRVTASSSEAASGLAGKVEAVPPCCPSFPQPALAVSSQETLFAEPICSLGTAWCSQSHEDDEGAAKIENPLSDSALALWAGDGNKDCPGLTRLFLLLSPLGSKCLPGKARTLPRGGRERHHGFLSTKNRHLILLSFGAANLLLRRNHRFPPPFSSCPTPIPCPPLQRFCNEAAGPGVIPLMGKITS